MIFTLESILTSLLLSSSNAKYSRYSFLFLVGNLRLHRFSVRYCKSTVSAFSTGFPMIAKRFLLILFANACASSIEKLVGSTSAGIILVISFSLIGLAAGTGFAFVTIFVLEL